MLPANSSLILAANPAAYRLRYGTDELVLGPFARGTQLSDAGERVTLEDASGNVLFTLNYQDATPWPESADGKGDVLQRSPTTTNPDLNDPTTWQSIALDTRSFHAAFDEITLEILHPTDTEDGSLRLEITLPRNIAPSSWTIESSSDLRQWATWPQSATQPQETSHTGTSTTISIPLENQSTSVATPYYFRLRAQDSP